MAENVTFIDVGITLNVTPVVNEDGFVTMKIKPEFKNNKKDVNSKGEEFAALNYTALIPILTKAIQEQQSTIENLQKQINELKTMIPITTAKVGDK